MKYQWLGAGFIILSCGGFGISIAARCKNEERLLHQLIRVLCFMRWELQYKLTPLPELCRLASKEVGGFLRVLLYSLAQELEQQLLPDAKSCMNTVLQEQTMLPRRLRRLLLQLGSSLGRFDLEGQIQGLESTEHACRAELETLRKNSEVRLRSYRTLGFSAGAALVILFV